jgi:hypothetical protein
MPLQRTMASAAVLLLAAIAASSAKIGPTASVLALHAKQRHDSHGCQQQDHM